MKYPKKYKGEKTLLKTPTQIENGKWRTGFLKPNGLVTDIVGIADHETSESCWICCNAFNKRVGYNDKEVKKIIKDVKKEKAKSKKKQKKGYKNSKHKSKSKNRKKK